MIILLNGPLGIGKSTLAEALGECIEKCVSLDGNHLVAGFVSGGRQKADATLPENKSELSA
jgi:adenylate kinase family enzyme